MSATPSTPALTGAGRPRRRGLAGLGERFGEWLSPGDSGTDPIQRWLGVLVLVGAGIVLGINYLAPDKRMIAVIVATVLFGVMWRVDLVTGIGVLVYAFYGYRNSALRRAANGAAASPRTA